MRVAILNPENFIDRHIAEVKKGAKWRFDAKNGLHLRCLAFLIVLMIHIYNVIPNSKSFEILNPGECIRDMTFVWTESQNKFLVENPKTRQKYMVYAGFLMDVFLLGTLSLFFCRFNTFRAPITFGTFMIARKLVQDHFLMGRPKGFAWFDPGTPSLTVPYHDTNDFYWSGHVGTSTILTIELFAQGYKTLATLGFLVGINQWILLMLVRTHYIIDLVTGLIFGHLFLINSEWICFILDVKVAGWNKEERKPAFHDLCPRCGWANFPLSQTIDKTEKIFLEKTQKERAKLEREIQAKNKNLA
jgi:hypothetical protein